MTTNTNAALRSAAKSALEALEALNGVDTETESVTIHVSDEIAALRASLAAAAAPAAVAGPSAPTLERLREWEKNGELMERVWGTLVEQENEIKRLTAAPTTQAAPQPAVQQGAPSQTSGMTLAQRILHVGGRNNAAGYVEFGSTQAVEALVRQVIRDLPPPAHPAAPVAQRDVREETSIGKAVNRAARDLPEGWEIRIDLERHAGVVHLIDPEGNETMIEGNGELFSDQISAAIDAASSQAKEGA